MTRIDDLALERAELEARISAQKLAAVTEVVATMERLGLTWADFGVAPIVPARPAAKRKVKYADAHGNHWSGTGQRPRWLAHALANGADLEQFRVRGDGNG